jgi:nucleoid-associated protein YgaU
MGYDLKKITMKSLIKKTSVANAKRSANRFIKDYDDEIRAKAGRSGLADFLGVNPANTWRLKMIDPPYTSFVGQHKAENLTEEIGSRIGEKSSLNKQQTDKTWLGGESSSVTFSTRVWASSSVKNVRETIETLRTFTRRDPQLKRAPLFVFTSGIDLQYNVFVKSIGGIQYDNARQDGTVRGVTFKLTLTVVDEVPTEQMSMSLASLCKTGLGLVTSAAASAWSSISSWINIPGGSLHAKGKKVIVRDGQTFEHIAQQEYGNAAVGDILRRVYYDNPKNSIKNALQVGDYIDLVAAEDIFSVPVTPQSIALKDTKVNLENIQGHFVRKNVERKIYPSG